MSELIIPPSSSDSPISYSHYGVQVSNSSDSVTLTRSSESPGTVNVLITSGNAFVAAIDFNDPTIFNVIGGAGSDTVETGAGFDIISTGEGDDVVNGGGSSDFIDGGSGNNLLEGGDLHDFMISGDGNDTLKGDGGIDLLVSGAGSDSLEGGADNDILISGAGKDTLVGGDGDDRLQGGQGKDSLIGGKGVDRFRFERGALGKGSKGGKKNADVIADFDPDGEVIELARGIFKGKNKVKPTDEDPNEFGCRPLMNEDDFAAVQKLSDGFGSAKIIYEKDTGLIYFNSNKGPAVLAQLDKNLNVTASNFELFY